jgi:hypothetical protein
LILRSSATRTSHEPDAIYSYSFVEWERLAAPPDWNKQHGCPDDGAAGREDGGGRARKQRRQEHFPEKWTSGFPQKTRPSKGI